MGVEKVVYKNVEIKLNDPQTAAKLQKYDRVEDDVVDAIDFYVLNPRKGMDAAEERVKSEVSETLGKTVLEKTAISKFLDVYHKVMKFDNETWNWHFSRTNKGGSELEFTEWYWNAKVAPLVTGEGEYTPGNLIELSKEVYQGIHLLADESPKNMKNPRLGVKCGEFIRDLKYNRSQIPEVLRDAVEDMSNRFTNSSKFLLKYKQIECEKGDCPEVDEVYLPKYGVLRGVYPADKYENRRTSACKSEGCSGIPVSPGFCFPGSTYLKTRNGLVSFEDLASMKACGKKLPEIASYNEKTGKVVYQRPTDLIDHGVVGVDGSGEGGLMRLSLEDEAGVLSTLEVTKMHPLFVLRQNGEKKWVKAGNLTKGDRLIGSSGRIFRYEPELSAELSGEDHLYNLTFSSVDGSLEPTYLVSQDEGSTWLIAHNKI